MIKSLLRQVRSKALNALDVPAVILLYHRVTTLSIDPQLLSVSPGNFEGHLQVLKRDYNVLSVDDFTSLVRARKGFPRKSVLITFDDGYADNHFEARPVLEASNLQALFYIATANISTSNEMWWDDLERIFLTDQKIPDTLSITLQEQPYTFNTSTNTERKATYEELLPLIRNCAPGARDAAIREMLAWGSLPREGRSTHRMMTFDELRQFANSKAVVIGAHTHNHPKLSVCTKEEQYHEIASSKANLEGLLQREIKHFSYPFGTKADYDEEALSICRSLEFDMVCSNFPRQVHRWTSKFELPRMLVRDWSTAQFEEKMKEFFNE